MQQDSPCSSGGETNCTEAYGKTAKQYRLFEGIPLHPRYTVTKQIVMELTGKGDSTAKNYINLLLKLDVLNREGESVSTVYRRK